jgi:hypothetical protein
VVYTSFAGGSLRRAVEIARDQAAKDGNVAALQSYGLQHGASFTLGAPIFGPEYRYSAKGDKTRDVVGYELDFQGTNKDCKTCAPKFFSNEGEAYKYMWDNSFDGEGKVKQELAAWLVGSGVLVLPTEGVTTYGEPYKNDGRHSKLSSLPLKWDDDGKPSVKWDGKFLPIIGAIHTHPNKQPFGSLDVAGDVDVQAFYKVPMYLIRTDGFFTLEKRLPGTKQDYFSGKKSIINGK